MTNLTQSGQCAITSKADLWPLSYILHLPWIVALLVKPNYEPNASRLPNGLMDENETSSAILLLVQAKYLKPCLFSLRDTNSTSRPLGKNILHSGSGYVFKKKKKRQPVKHHKAVMTVKKKRSVIYPSKQLSANDTTPVSDTPFARDAVLIWTKSAELNFLVSLWSSGVERRGAATGAEIAAWCGVMQCEHVGQRRPG